MYVSNKVFRNTPLKAISGKASVEGSIIPINPLIMSGIRGSEAYANT
jgi:hypothetical protein